MSNSNPATTSKEEEEMVEKCLQLFEHKLSSEHEEEMKRFEQQSEIIYKESLESCKSVRASKVSQKQSPEEHEEYCQERFQSKIGNVLVSHFEKLIVKYTNITSNCIRQEMIKGFGGEEEKEEEKALETCAQILVKDYINQTTGLIGFMGDLMSKGEHL